ncbi:MAG: tripartite tricarboxylate transporter TctB family protein [Planctomycetota bacterium]|jgi:putative tricarboxylic transport membrane protein|nr:tripartite tricarboxylate transporter TctB family protein [Planctomycetota bacterium]
MKNTRLADLVMGLLFVFLAIYWFVEAEGMVKADAGLGPGDYPKVVAAGLFLLGLLLAVSSLLAGLPRKEGAMDRKAALRLILFVAATIVYVQLMKPLGFLLTTPFYLFFGMWFFGYRKYAIAAVCSVGMTAAIHVVFRMIFQVMLPELRLF